MPAGDLAELVAGREQFRELEAAILKLPEEQRCILLMTVVGEMSSSQIGSALSMPPGTVRYKLFQARQSLAQQLGMLDAQPARSSAEGGNRYG
jgi:RNA polymerase sigma-70 factor (ECF subfamily)